MTGLQLLGSCTPMHTVMILKLAAGVCNQMACGSLLEREPRLCR
jgi:hypothetical protein